MNGELFDPQLIQKYDQPGPRYTSYPTAPLFQENIAADALRENLEHPTAEPLSLYIHIPFCFRLCWYCGCNMEVARSRPKMDDHLALLSLEIERVAAHADLHGEVQQLHFGGGSPNHIPPQKLAELLVLLRSHFSFSATAEISLEADPRLLGDAQLEALANAGFNRISLGVQDFDSQVQRAINRIQPFETVSLIMQKIKTLGFSSVNMDLMYGLPFQNPQQFHQTVLKAASLDPDRISLFNFAYLPSLKPHMKLISPETLPKPRWKWKMLTDTVTTLEQAGYQFIGMDHFAKPQDPLCLAAGDGTLHRNFQGYSTLAGTRMLAFGMSAISSFDALLVQNYRSVTDYEQAVRRGEWATWRGLRLTRDDRLRRDIINDLMCRFEIDPVKIGKRAGVSFESYFPRVPEKLTEMKQDGLLVENDGVFHLTEVGRLLMRNVAMLFDRYFEEIAKSTQFSRTV